MTTTTSAEAPQPAEPTTTTTDSGPSSFVKYKVAIVGAGAVGGYYGARLWEVGHDVQFFTRSTTPSQINDGLRVTSIAGDVHIPAHEWHVYNSTSAMQPADWILVAFKTTALEHIPDCILPLLKPDQSSRVLVIMNGLIEDDLIALLNQKVREQQQQQQQQNKKKHDETSTTTSSSKEKEAEPQQQQPPPPSEPKLLGFQTLYGGMAFLCSNRLSPTHIDHSYAGTLSAGVAATNTPVPNDDDRNDDGDQMNADERALRQLFFQPTTKTIAEDDDDQEAATTTTTNSTSPTGQSLTTSGAAGGDTCIPLVYESNLLRGRWKKMIWNLPFNGISVAMGGITIDQVVSDPGLRQLADQIMDEVIAVGNAELGGCSTTEEEDDVDLWLGNDEKVQMMELSDRMGPYRTSTMLDLVHRRPMEVRYLFEEPLQRALKYKIPTPTLQTIVTMVQAYQRKYSLY